MSLDDLYDQLKTVYTTAYLEFPESEVPAPPYLCYYDTGSTNFVAENKVYHVILDVTVELYTREKDPSAEAAVEAIFDLNDIPWQKTSEFLEDENIFCVTYTMEV